MINRIVKCAWVAPVLLAWSVSATAAPNFSFVEVDYRDGETLGIDSDGFALTGQLDLTENWYIYGRYADTELDVSGGGSLDFQRISIGGGFHGPLTSGDDLEWFGKLTYEHFDIDLSIPGFASGSDDEDGFAAEVGLRADVHPMIELYASTLFIKVADDIEDRTTSVDFGDDVADGFGYTLGGVLNIQDRIAVGLGYEDVDGFEEIKLNIRVYLRGLRLFGR